MRKIDWYILKKFLVTFFFCLFLFTIIAVAVDSSEKADDIVTANLSTWQIIQQYYFGFVPWIWGLLFPLFVFIAVIFFTSRMATRSEFIAILASGTSYRRVLRPYFIGGLLLGIILLAGNFYFIPKANIARSNFLYKYVDNNDGSKNRNAGYCDNCFYRRLDTNTFVGIKYYDTLSKSAQGFFLQRLKGDRVIYNLRASNLQWDTATRKWKLTNVIERIVDSLKETVKYHSSFSLDINLKPGDLRKDKYLKDKLTTPELVAYITKEEARGTEGLNTFKVERYRRTATPAAVLLLTMIGAFIASRKTRGGSGLHLALGFIIAALFVLSDRFSTVFATNANFHPLIAAWLPNLVFAGVAYWLYRKTPK